MAVPRLSIIQINFFLIYVGSLIHVGCILTGVFFLTVLSLVTLLLLFIRRLLLVSYLLFFLLFGKLAWLLIRCGARIRTYLSLYAWSLKFDNLLQPPFACLQGGATRFLHFVGEAGIVLTISHLVIGAHPAILDVAGLTSILVVIFLRDFATLHLVVPLAGLNNLVLDILDSIREVVLGFLFMGRRLLRLILLRLLLRGIISRLLQVSSFARVRNARRQFLETATRGLLVVFFGNLDTRGLRSVIGLPGLVQALPG